MKIYISCHHPDPANELATTLEAAGHAVYSTWHRPGQMRPDINDWAAWAEKAEHNFLQIQDSDALVLIASPDHVSGAKRVSGGKFVEAGYAMGCGVPVLILGGVENGMLHTPPVFTNTGDVLAELARY